MSRTRIKICGMRRREDVVRAGELGVDAVGLVFYAPSPRAVSVDQARELVRAKAPFVSAVGLFLDARPALVERVLEAVPLDLLQFHGDESPADCGRYGVPYIKAVAMGGGIDVAAYVGGYPDASGFLLDSHERGQAGGTGESFDWGGWPRSMRCPLILAGGLGPGTVAAAIRATAPYGVDVSSGVESRPGVKDSVKMEQFVEEVRRVDCEQD